MTITAPHPTTAPLVADRLCKSFAQGVEHPVQALDDVSVHIRPGQSVSVMGPSGSGKSTLLHLLAGIIRPDSGQVRLGADPVSVASDAVRSRLRRTWFGFVFQDGQLLAELTAAENVALPLMLNGCRRPAAVAHATAWLHRLGLAGLETRRPGQMSGGQAQRVAVARALVHSPAVVMADEPTGALDTATGAQVMQLLTEATAQAGASLLVVTHDQGVAAWCQRHLVILDGRLESDSGGAR
ncbi:MAG: ABC transporter ATP-binding protein [Micrococcales bacterium]|nr:ABC transporter ATP-binding protein [Micrococcales bacterium]